MIKISSALLILTVIFMSTTQAASSAYRLPASIYQEAAPERLPPSYSELFMDQILDPATIGTLATGKIAGLVIVNHSKLSTKVTLSEHDEKDECTLSYTKQVSPTSIIFVPSKKLRFSEHPESTTYSAGGMVITEDITEDKYFSTPKHAILYNKAIYFIELHQKLDQPNRYKSFPYEEAQILEPGWITLHNFTGQDAECSIEPVSFTEFTKIIKKGTSLAFESQLPLITSLKINGKEIPITLPLPKSISKRSVTWYFLHNQPTLEAVGYIFDIPFLKNNKSNK